MSKTLNQGLNIGIPKDTGGTMGQALVQCFIHYWLEGLNDNLDAEITITIKDLPAINVFKLQSPFANVYYLIT